MFHPERILPTYFRTHLAKDPDVNAIILDEHGPGFAITFSWRRQVQSGPGGGIRESNGTRPQTPELEKNCDAAAGRPVDTYSSIRLDMSDDGITVSTLTAGPGPINFNNSSIL